MIDAWVVNASPIIVLAKVGQMALLDEPGVEILVPDAVIRDVMCGPESDPARRTMERGWGARLARVDVPPRILEWSLGLGESEVLSAAMELPGRVAVLDDAEARACARSLGIPVIGTLGLVLRARRMGRIESASRLLEGLRDAGFFIDERFLRDILDRIAGESWPPA